jgi:hypothetical protein
MPPVVEAFGPPGGVALPIAVIDEHCAIIAVPPPVAAVEVAGMEPKVAVEGFGRPPDEPLFLRFGRGDGYGDGGDRRRKPKQDTTHIGDSFICSLRTDKETPGECGCCMGAGLAPIQTANPDLGHVR